jgi:hypothetical protein
VQQWRSDAFSPAHKCQFPLQRKWVVVDAGCWHILNQLKTTTTCRHVPKKHIRKKPILLLCTVPRPLHQTESHPPGGIILHIQRRNWYTFHRSHGRCKKGRVYIAARTRGTLKQCQVFCHRAHQDGEDISMRTRAVFDRGRGTDVRRTRANNTRLTLMLRFRGPVQHSRFLGKRGWRTPLQ